jgi:hypothetical protein
LPYISAVFRQPLNRFHHLGGEFDASLADLEALVVDAALAAVDIEKTAGDDGRVDGPVLVDPLLEAALTALTAEPFPFGLRVVFHHFGGPLTGWNNLISFTQISRGARTRTLH